MRLFIEVKMLNLERIIERISFRKSFITGIGMLIFGFSNCGDTIIFRPPPPDAEDISVESSQEDTYQPDYNDFQEFCKEKQFFKDNDNDAYGDKQFPKWECEKPPGYVDNFLDCVDVPEQCGKYSEDEEAYNYCINNPRLIHLGAIEVCNGVDDDCDGKIDENLDCCEPGDIKDTVYCPPYDFVFVIDNSESMDDSDPEDIRYEGIYGFIDKMDEDDRGLMIPFASEACVVSSGSCIESPIYYPFTSNKDELSSNIETAKTALGGGTAIGNAIVIYAIPSLNQSDSGKAIILLTDGKTADSGEYPPVDMSQDAISHNIRLYTLGLGSGVDENYLKQLATTKGGYFFIQSPQQIPVIYNEIVKGLKFQEWQECSENHTWIEKFNDCGN